MFIEIEDMLINLDNVTVIYRRNPAVNSYNYYLILIDTVDNKQWELKYETEEERNKKWGWLREIVRKR